MIGVLRSVCASGVAAAACHPLRLFEARSLAWAAGGPSRPSRRCFVEAHGVAVFWAGLPWALFWSLLAALPVTLVPFAPVAGALYGALFAPARLALLAAQRSSASPLSLRLVLLSALMDCVVASLVALLRPASLGQPPLDVLLGAAAVAAAVVATGPLHVAFVRGVFPRQKVVALERLLRGVVDDDDDVEDEDREGGEDEEGWCECDKCRRGAPRWAREWVLPALPARLLNGVLSFVVAQVWLDFFVWLEKQNTGTA